jgi:hypothetical protein
MKICVTAFNTRVYIQLDNPEAWYRYYTPPDFGVWDGW